MNTVLNKCFCSDNNRLNISENNRNVRYNLIKEVVLETLKEMSISFAMTGICCLFMTAPAIPSLLIVTISVIAVNLLVRCILARELYELHIATQRGEGVKEVKQLETSICLLQFICPCSFSIQHLVTSNVLIHEEGHALAALAVYQNPKPTIEVTLFGGVTKYQWSPLSRIGEYFGRQRAEAFVSAAGTGLGVVSASLMIGMSHILKKDHPQLSLYLLSSGIATIAQSVLYALSTLWEASPPLGHDFVALWRYGVHPLVSVICIVALPILVKLALYLISKPYSNHNPASASSRFPASALNLSGTVA